MKAVDMLKALGVVLCVAVASSAYAQSSDTASTDSAMSAKADAKTHEEGQPQAGPRCP